MCFLLFLSSFVFVVSFERWGFLRFVWDVILLCVLLYLCVLIEVFCVVVMVVFDVIIVFYMVFGRFFCDYMSVVNVFDFYYIEDVFVIMGDDDVIYFYNINIGVKMCMLYSKKYGCMNVCFMYSVVVVIYGSRNKGAGGAAIDDYAVRYYLLYDNMYLWYFKGYIDVVMLIVMNLMNDCFLIGSVDFTVRMWDLRTSKCCAVILECLVILYVVMDV